MSRTDNKKKWLLWLSAIIFSAAAGWFVCNHILFKDERLIRILVQELCSNVSRSSGKSDTAVLLNAAAAEQIFSPEVEIICDSPQVKRTFTAKELIKLMLMYQKNHSSLQLTIEEDKIELTPPAASFSGTAILNGCNSKERFREIRNVEIFCRKNENKWLINKVKIYQILSK